MSEYRIAYMIDTDDGIVSLMEAYDGRVAIAVVESNNTGRLCHVTLSASQLRALRKIIYRINSRNDNNAVQEKEYDIGE